MEDLMHQIKTDADVGMGMSPTCYEKPKKELEDVAGNICMVMLQVDRICLEGAWCVRRPSERERFNTAVSSDD